MFLKNPRVIIPILIYLILLGPVLRLYSSSPPETEVQVYKGAWYPIVMASHFAEMKDMGMNTVMFRGDPGEGTVTGIQAAHRNGLKVALTTDFAGPYLQGIDKYSDYWTFMIIETAKVAEKYRVEFFAPLAEPENIFGKNTGRWAQEILPKIKEVYHGEVFWKGATLLDMDFSGYDYIGFATYMGKEITSEEYSQAVSRKLNQALGFAERDNCKGVMIAEFGSWQNHGPEDIERGYELVFELISGKGEHTAVGKEDVVRAYDVVLETGKDKAVGFFFFDEYPGVPAEFKEVVSRWYKEIL